MSFLHLSLPNLSLRKNMKNKKHVDCAADLLNMVVWNCWSLGLHWVRRKNSKHFKNLPHKELLKRISYLDWQNLSVSKTNLSTHGSFALLKEYGDDALGLVRRFLPPSVAKSSC
jgi:hypothetical protein